MEQNKMTIYKAEYEETIKVTVTSTKESVDWINGSNHVEQNKVILMRAFVEKHDPSSKDVDDFMLRRFLRARDLDIEKASAMFLKYMKWGRSFVPDGIISASFFVQNSQIVFVENKKLKSTLLEDIDESQIPQIYGGKLKLVPIQDSSLRLYAT